MTNNEQPHPVSAAVQTRIRLLASKAKHYVERLDEMARVERTTGRVVQVGHYEHLLLNPDELRAFDEQVELVAREVLDSPAIPEAIWRPPHTWTMNQRYAGAVAPEDTPQVLRRELDATVRFLQSILPEPTHSSNAAEEKDHSRSKAGTKNGISIFISHSAKDVELVKAFVACLEACIEVPDTAIRCTSVPGYRLAPGDVSDDVLRGNLEQCSVVIGLLTENSLSAGYVIMELGAAWGLRKTTCALLAPTVEFAHMPGPLSRLHAVKADTDHDVISLMDAISEHTGLKMRNRAKCTAAIAALVASVHKAQQN